MKVPVINDLSAKQGGELGFRPNLESPDYSAAQDIAGAGKEIGGAIGGTMGSAVSAYEKIKKEADGVNTADGLSSFQKEITEQSYGAKRQDGSEVTGFYSLQGKAAFEQNQAYLESLEKRRSDIAGKLTSDRQRKDFDIHSRRMLEQAREDFGKHAWKQSAEVKAKSTDALHDVMIDRIIADPDNYESMRADRDMFWKTQNDINLGLSKEERDAASFSMMADIATARVTGYLAQGMPEKAKAYIETDAARADLGARIEKIKPKVDEAYKAKETKLDQQWAGTETLSILRDDKVVDDNGIVNTEEALIKASKVEFDETEQGVRRRKMFESSMQHQIATAEKQKKAYVTKYVGDGQLLFTEGGWRISAIPPEIAQKVQRYDPKQWDRWVKQEAEVLAGYRREARIRSNGGRGSGAAQADENRRAKAMLNRALVDMPDEEKKDLNIDAFIAENDLRPTPGVAEEMRLYKSKSIDADGKATDKDRDKFLKDTLKVVNGEIERLGGKTRTNPGDISKMERLRDDAISMAAEEYDLNKSVKKAPLTPEEKAKVQASIAGSTTVKIGIFKDTTVPAFVSPEYKRKNPDAIGAPAPSIVVQSPAPKKQAPGRYKDPKSGRFFIVDTNGARKWEK